MKTKYIIVIGSIISGLGKGVCSASVSKLLKDQGYTITNIKIDGYYNCDAGVLSPLEHGETFVTNDGGEIDLDFGTYERFSDIELHTENSITSGKVYYEMLEAERKGEFLGKTVQLIPHYVNYINNKIIDINKKNKSDICIIEIGGTLGDSESDLFIESCRQLKRIVGKENILYLCLTYIPYLKTSKELKTKPTQMAVRQLRSYGINPDIILCRTEKHLDHAIKSKMATFCDVNNEDVFEGIDVNNIYEVPIKFHNQKMDKIICEKLKLEYNENKNIKEWETFVNKINNIKQTINISLVGKYVQLHDAYLSVTEALKHAGIYHDVKINVNWVDSELLIDDDTTETYLKNSDGIIVPGGFGDRGISGMVYAAKYARENKIPYLGICLGMQIAAIEFARDVLGLEDANSTEFDKDTENPVIHIMEDQKYISNMGGTMRLGAYDCKLKLDSVAHLSYGSELISERHRHRYEFNDEYTYMFEKHGLEVTGINPEFKLTEIIEVKDHPFFVGVQFHPEFKSRPTKPHPIFKEFILASKTEK